MLEFIKVVKAEDGTEYRTTQNRREFLEAQVKSVENGTITIEELAIVDNMPFEMKADYESMGLLAYLKSDEFYNYALAVALFQFKRVVAHNVFVEEQDTYDMQLQAYTTLREAFVKDCADNPNKFTADEFNTLCHNITRRVVNKIAYARHRFDMDNSFNLTYQDDNGNIQNETLDHLMQFVTNKSVQKIEKQTKLDNKAFERGIHSIELIEKLGNALSIEENARLRKYLTRKVDGEKLATKERVDLHRLCRKVESYEQAVKQNAKQTRKYNQAVWQELLTEKRAEKKQAQAIRQATLQEYKNNKTLNANANLAEAKTMIFNRIEHLEHKAVVKAYTEIVADLQRVKAQVIMCPSQKKLRDIRKILNNINDDIKGVSQAERENRNRLSSIAKDLLKGQASC